MIVLMPVSPGELLDRLTILEIKAARLPGAARQLERLLAVRAATLPPEDPATGALVAELRHVNRRLWDVEDALRAHERAGDFGAEFVALARSVYALNDRRAAAKRAIDAIHGLEMAEPKSHGGEFRLAAPVPAS
jgi:hypothetical protein